MASLIRTFQADIISSSKSVTELLRTAKLISVKLGLNGIAEWIGYELSGYPPSSSIPIPDFRSIRGGQLQVWNPYRGWVPCGNLGKVFNIGQSIPELEELKSAKTVVIPLTQSQNYTVTGNTGLDMSNWQQQIELPSLQIKGIVQSVRDKLLDWSLEMEKSGIVGEDMSFDKNERESAHSQTFHIQNATGFFGNASNSQVTIYDYSSIHQTLKQAEVPQVTRNELENLFDALKTAKPEEKKSLLEKSKRWLVKNEAVLGAGASIVRKAFGFE